MGLDSVELVIAFEEAFGVAIEDAAAEKMRTPRDVIDFIARHRGSGTKKLCLTRRAFHKIREHLMAVGVARSAIRPDARLEQIFPADIRCALWIRARGEISRWQWPDLVRPVRLQNTISILPLVIASAVLVTTLIRISGSRISSAIIFAVGSAILSAFLLLRITETQRRHFPGLNTVRDLAIRTAIGTAGLLREGEEFTRDQIAATVKAIVIEQLGISESRYGEDKDFVRDLGMN